MASPPLLIGVDFDNTIVCYDEVFRKIAIERKLISPDSTISKRALHDQLHGSGLGDIWTEIQGEVYGPLMREAKPFPGALDFFRRCRAGEIPVCIISHRTRYPYAGQGHDLHQAGRDWLATHGFHDSNDIGLPQNRVFFEESRKLKLRRIANTHCTDFVEDLIEVLTEPGFPASVRKILFDPGCAHADFNLAPRAVSWRAVEEFFGIAAVKE